MRLKATIEIEVVLSAIDLEKDTLSRIGQSLSVLIDRFCIQENRSISRQCPKMLFLIASETSSKYVCWTGPEDSQYLLHPCYFFMFPSGVSLRCHFLQSCFRLS